MVGIWAAVLLGAVNIRVFHNDNIPNVLLPVSVLRDRDLELSEFTAVLEREPEGERYWAVHSSSGTFSKYPIWTGVLAAPLLAPVAAWYGQTTNEYLWLACGRLVALACSAAFTGILACTLRRRMSGCWAILLSFCAVFGTALWHHLGSHLTNQVLPSVCLAAILALLLRGRMNAPTALGVGLLAGLAVAARLPVIFAAGMPLGVFVTRRCWRRLIPWVALGGLAFPLLTLWYNTAAFGHPLRTGYSFYQQDAFSGDLLPGAAGLLISPACGLLFYSPFLLAGLWAGWMCVRAPAGRDHDLGRWILAGVIGQWLLFARWWCWNGALTFGCRMMIETVPLLVVLMAITWQHRAGTAAGRRFLWISGAMAVLHHGIGTVAYDAVAPDNPLKPDWDWTADFIVLYVQRFGLAECAGDLLRCGGLFAAVLGIGGYLASRFFVPGESESEAVALST